MPTTNQGYQRKSRQARELIPTFDPFDPRIAELEEIHVAAFGWLSKLRFIQKRNPDFPPNFNRLNATARLINAEVAALTEIVRRADALGLLSIDALGEIEFSDVAEDCAIYHAKCEVLKANASRSAKQIGARSAEQTNVGSVGKEGSVSSLLGFKGKRVELTKVQFDTLCVNHLHGDEDKTRETLQDIDTNLDGRGETIKGDHLSRCLSWLATAKKNNQGRDYDAAMRGGFGRKKTNHELNMELLAKTMAEEGIAE